MDYKILWVFTIIAVVLGSGCISEEKNEGLMKEGIYIEPNNCTKCNISMVKELTKDMGFNLTVYSSDVEDAVLVLMDKKNNTSIIIEPGTRYNIAEGACKLTNESNVCEMADIEKEKQIKNRFRGCPGEHNVSIDSVIFYHATWCGYCNKMMPIVKKLEGEGYSFHWAETSDKEAAAVVNDCFSDVIGRGVPEFVCAANREVKMGAVPEETLREFADNCKKASEKV